MPDKILSTFWMPPEAAAAVTTEFELVFPQEEVTGRFSLDETRQLIADAAGIIVLMEPMDKAMIDLGRNLRVIGRLGVGCDSVDCEYAGGKGIAVINTPVAVTHPTAELAIAIMMDVARCTSRLDRKFRREGRCAAPASYDPISSTLYGKTLGIIGFGRIGRAVGEKARGLGMRVIYADPISAPAAAELAAGARRVELPELLRDSDFVTIHCQYTPENHHLMNDRTLGLMKPTAYLVNASRGKMVDEAALVRALQGGKIKGAALDVYEMEPEVRPELLTMENVVLTPHIGTWSYDSRVAMAIESLTGMCEFLRGGNPANIFNRDSLKRK